MPAIWVFPLLPTTSAPGRFLVTSTPQPARHTMCLAGTASPSFCLAPVTRRPDATESSTRSPDAVALRGSTSRWLEVHRWNGGDHDRPTRYTAGAYGLCYGCAGLPPLADA